MKKPIIFLLVLITNILFISAQKISKTELKDKIAGAWIGQMVGNIYGLPFENKFEMNLPRNPDFHSVTLKI